MYVQLEQDDQTDPRILRTRELLINGFAKLLDEHKSIRKVSVQSVTKQAGVNRVTFYAHFTDKYELLDVWARLMYRQSVARWLPANATFIREHVTLLIDATLDFFIMHNQYRRRVNEQFEPMFEAAIQQELESFLVSMLKSSPLRERSITTENIASFLSWAIFGSALDWSRQPEGQAKEVMSGQLVSMIEVITN
jgi:AcrR family transcriptional regulator